MKISSAVQMIMTTVMKIVRRVDFTKLHTKNQGKTQNVIKVSGDFIF